MQLCFDNFDFGFVTNNVIAFFNLTGTADVEADGGVEFERVTAGRGFRLPNITPISYRIWLMKTTNVLVRLMWPVSLRRAWLIRRACRPTWLSPISPSISALGTSALRSRQRPYRYRLSVPRYRRFPMPARRYPVGRDRVLRLLRRVCGRKSGQKHARHR